MLSWVPSMALPKHRLHIEVRGQPSRSSRTTPNPSQTEELPTQALKVSPTSQTWVPQLETEQQGPPHPPTTCGRDGMKRACAPLVLMG